jgi:integrase
VSDDLEPLDPRPALRFYIDQRRSELSDETIKSHRYRLQKFVEWCDQQLIINYLGKYHYASRDHMVLLLWRLGCRTGGLRALDLDDYDPDAPGLELVHRPEADTPLKNQGKGERWVALRGHTADVIDAYIDGPRHDVTDDYGRRPLLTTVHGRVATTTMRSAVYRWTRPCVVGDECPHDRDPDTCEAVEREYASKCPSARSPHDVRSGSITAHLRDDVPVEILGDRMNVSQDVLDVHYDRRTEREKMEQRRQYVE